MEPQPLNPPPLTEPGYFVPPSRPRKSAAAPCGLACVLGCGLCFVVLVLLLILRVAHVLNSYYIPSKAMTPTLQPGDLILTSAVPYMNHQPQRGDIVVFVYPDPVKSHPKVDYIKRIVGLPGETVEVRNGSVLINGAALSELYISEPAYADSPLLTVPAGKYFVLGDNRNHSSDSRVWGMLDRKNIEAKMLFRYWRSPK